MRKRKWSEKQLREAVLASTSVRQVIGRLGLKEAGGNYEQIKKYLKYYQIDISKIKGKGWKRGLKFPFKPKVSLKEILIEDSDFQSYKLKKRLFISELKKERCEICGWAKKSIDGRIPLELDHINGNRRDNRIVNLRILCPNCHSMQPTHRGRNIKRVGGGTGIRATLKMSS